MCSPERIARPRDVLAISRSNQRLPMRSERVRPEGHKRPKPKSACLESSLDISSPPNGNRSATADAGADQGGQLGKWGHSGLLTTSTVPPKPAESRQARTARHLALFLPESSFNGTFWCQPRPALCRGQPTRPLITQPLDLLGVAVICGLASHGQKVNAQQDHRHENTGRKIKADVADVAVWTRP